MAVFSVFSWRAEVRPGVWVAFTDATAGNLALHVGDDPEQVRRRRRDIEQAAGLGHRRFRYMNQVHGNVVAAIEPVATGAAEPEAPVADALVSTEEPLAVMVADCVPVILVGEREPGMPGSRKPVLGAVHAGRPGVASGVVPAAVEQLRALGAERVSAWIGPSICGGCYEVPQALRAEVAGLVPSTWCTTSAGSPGLDLPAGVRSQLEAEAVTIEYTGGCTLEDKTLFSYRGDPGTGRFAGLVWADTSVTHGVRGLTDD